MSSIQNPFTGGSVRLPTADLDALLTAAEAVDGAMPTDVAIKDILRVLSGLVYCDLLFWARFDVQNSFKIAEVGYPGPPHAQTVTDWMAHRSKHAIYSASDGPRTYLGDVLDPGEPRERWLYAIHWRQASWEHGIGINLSHPFGEIQDIVFSRGRGSGFSDRDHVVLRLLRPHLDSALRRLAYPAPRLTPRELEVLRYVRDGMPNHRIAHALGIAECTVIKHLEHIYTRTGAHSRTQAVQLCSSALD